jgi:hypothetical protein
MSKIDAGIHSAKQESETNTTNIGNLSTLNTDVKSSVVGAINEVNEKANTNNDNIGVLNTNVATNTSSIGNLANLQTTNKTNLVNAVNENKTSINALINKIGNMTIRNYSDGTNVIVENGSLTANTMSLAYSTDMTLFKLYGFVRLTKSSGANAKIRFKLPIGMNNLVESDYTIRCAVGKGNQNNSDITSFQSVQFDKTNNEIYYESGASTDTAIYLFFLPCLYFNQVFNIE